MAYLCRFAPARLAFDSFMQTAGLPAEKQDTSHCLAHLKCRPFGGHSVWASLGAPVTNTTRVVMAVASLDSAALFSQHATGADADISGVVALLAAAAALSTPKAAVAETPPNPKRAVPPAQPASSSSPSLQLDKLPRRIVFAFFAGEAHDYVGSRKFVDDISTLRCKSLKAREVFSAANPHGVKLYPDADGAAYTNAKGTYCADPVVADMTFQQLSLDRIDRLLEMRQVSDAALD